MSIILICVLDGVLKYLNCDSVSSLSVFSLNKFSDDSSDPYSKLFCINISDND